MDFNPKWLELLKASGWQTAAIAIACGIFVLLADIGMLPQLPILVFLAASFTGILCACLAAASIASAAYKIFPIHIMFLKWNKRRNDKNDLRNYIPYMTPVERRIISYLLAHNQKTFTAELDGGYASTLISLGIVVPHSVRGQRINHSDVPMTIPNHCWDVLVEHTDRFPYLPTEGEEPLPWRVSWMA